MGTLVEMIATASVDAWIDVPQQYAGAIVGHVGGPLVTIIVEATGARIESSDLRIVPQVDPKARTFSIVVRLDNAEGQLRAGMAADVSFPGVSK